jgi:hypothetical protein
LVKCWLYEKEADEIVSSPEALAGVSA